MSRALLLLLAVASVVGCGGGGDDEVSATTTAPAADATPDGQATEPEDLGRVVVLGEEFLLADVLALGVEPVAATATLGDSFSGIERDTAGIEPLSATELGVEQVIALEPDLLIASSFIAEEAGEDVLRGIAEAIVVPDLPDWRERVTSLAEELGRSQRAVELLAAYDETVAAANAELPDDLTVSMASVYPGENIGVWVSGPTNIPATFVDAGVTLRPGPGTFPDESQGRAFVSTERLSVLEAETLVLLQSSAVEGEDVALDAVRGTALWATLPAVSADRVVVLDRLGYPGVEGRTRLAAQLPELLG